MFLNYLIKPLIIMLVSYILFSSCDSALSDIEFNDPSVLIPTIRVYRDETIATGVETGITVYISDKNFQLVDLKNGKVTANNIELIQDTMPLPQPFDSIFENGKYYISSENFPEISFNKNYIIDITLSDDKTYSSNVTTQQAFEFFNCPQNHIQSTNMNINWDVLNEFETTLKISYIYVTNDGTHTFEKSIDIPEESLDSGIYTISSYYFKTALEPYDAIIKIENKKPGEINNAFKDGSILSIYSVEKTTHVYLQ